VLGTVEGQCHLAATANTNHFVLEPTNDHQGPPVSTPQPTRSAGSVYAREKRKSDQAGLLAILNIRVIIVGG
jgi:hypothetical protein